MLGDVLDVKSMEEDVKSIEFQVVGNRVAGLNNNNNETMKQLRTNCALKDNMLLFYP